MIKIENVVLASPKQMVFIIQGMRNPKNSWDKSDSRTCKQDGSFCMECEHKYGYCLGSNDKNLMQRLSRAGDVYKRQVLFMKTAIYKLIFVGIITLALMVVLLLLQIKNILPEIYE